MALETPKKSRRPWMFVVVLCQLLAAYFFVLQHRIDDISLAIHRRLELVVDDDGLFAGMSLQHAAFEAPEIEK